MWQIVLVLFKQIGYDNCDAAADPNDTVYEDIGLLPGFFQKLISLLKVVFKVVVLVIFCGNVGVVGYVLSGVVEVCAFGAGEDGFVFEF